MRISYMVSALAFLIGLGLIITASVIKHRVSEGEGRIAGAQSQVDEVRGLTDFDEYTAEVGEIITEPAQRRIDVGVERASHYHTLSNWLMALGVLFVIFGILLGCYTRFVTK